MIAAAITSEADAAAASREGGGSAPPPPRRRRDTPREVLPTPAPPVPSGFARIEGFFSGRGLGKSRERNPDRSSLQRNPDRAISRAAARMLLQRRSPQRDAYVCPDCLQECGAGAMLRELSTAPLRPHDAATAAAAEARELQAGRSTSSSNKPPPAATRCTVCHAPAPAELLAKYTDAATAARLGAPAATAAAAGAGSSAPPSAELAAPSPTPTGAARTAPAAGRGTAMAASATARADPLTLGSEASPPRSLAWECFDPLRLVDTGGEAGWGAAGGRQLTRCGSDGYTAALGTPLWRSGVHTLTFRIDRARHGTGNMLLGVADAAQLFTRAHASRGWALHPFYSTLFATEDVHVPGASTERKLSPGAELRGVAPGARVSVLVDMRRRALAFSVNGGSWVDAEVELPAAVRPYAALYWEGDAVSLRAMRTLDERGGAYERLVARGLWSAVTLKRVAAAAAAATSARAEALEDGDGGSLDDDYFRRRELRELMLDPELRRSVAALDPESAHDLVAHDHRLRELLRARNKGLPPALWSRVAEEELLTHRTRLKRPPKAARGTPSETEAPLSVATPRLNRAGVPSPPPTRPCFRLQVPRAHHGGRTHRHHGRAARAGRRRVPLSLPALGKPADPRRPLRRARARRAAATARGAACAPCVARRARARRSGANGSGGRGVRDGDRACLPRGAAAAAAGWLRAHAAAGQSPGGGRARRRHAWRTCGGDVVPHLQRGAGGGALELPGLRAGRGGALARGALLQCGAGRPGDRARARAADGLLRGGLGLLAMPLLQPVATHPPVDAAL